jgi:hypothetical protein
MTKISITGRSYYVDPANPSPPLSTNPGGFVYRPTSPRLMYTIASPRIEFAFQAPPTQFEMEGFGAEINEIKRPYSLPIADIYGGKLRRLSFEFALIRKVAVPPNQSGKSFSYYDGMTNSIEDQLERLQLVVDTGLPVGFENMSPHIQAYSWLVDDMKWSLTRDDATGNAVAGTCSMSFIEFRPARQRFILMPRFAYGVPASSVKKGAKDKTGGNGVTAGEQYIKAAFQKKVQNAIGAGKIRYPFNKNDLQKLLDAAAKDLNKPYFTIPDDWINQLRTTYNPRLIK